MLNISKTSISKYVVPKKYSTLEKVEAKNSSKILRKSLITTFVTLIIIVLLPWTQNIRSNGNVTTLKPNQKPQSLNSIISGRIEEWHVQEGDFVNKGDTILRISEVKQDYFDEQLLDRTSDQLEFKKQSITTYGNKVNAQEEQLLILKDMRDTKLKQSRIKYQQALLKTQNDSLSYQAAIINLNTAEYQLKRMDSLRQQGLKSLTDYEAKNLKFQEVKAYELAAKNKWFNSKNELISLQLEITNVQIKFETDYAKISSDKFSTQALKLESETSLSKLENQYSNYAYRNGLYFITAPQDGYITKTTSSGIGETIKEGQEILTIMPKNYDLAVEIYVAPIDLPLINIGEKVRLQFDGWPAIIFSGWPNASHGTYGGKIYAVDQYISDNGKYRVLVAPDETDAPWPDALRFGSGTSTLIMLNDVPIWYELWRNINGFPPQFYQVENESKKSEKK